MSKHISRIRIVGPVAVAALVLVAAAARAETDFDSLAKDGRLALDTGRVASAVKYFEQASAVEPARVAEIAPDRCWAYIRLGNDALMRKDRDSANSCYTLAYDLYPPFAKTFSRQWVFVRAYYVNEALVEAGRNPKRAPWPRINDMLRWCLKFDPTNPQIRYLYGSAQNLQNKPAEAKHAFLAVLGDSAPRSNSSLKALSDAAMRRVSGMSFSIDMRPTNPLWEKSDPGPWQTLKSGPFTIHHHNAALAERIAAVMEYDLTQPILSGALTYHDPFPDECNVYIYPNRQAFKKSGETEKWAAGTSKFSFVDGKLQSASIQFFQTAPDLTESAVPHELAHVRLVASAHFAGGLPLWLQEGVATSAQSEFSKVNMARTLIEGRDNNHLISVVDLVNTEEYPEGDESDLYYGESLAIVESLVSRYGKDNFWRFVSILQHDDQVNALKRAYGMSPVRLEDLVLKWIEDHQAERRHLHGRSGTPATPPARTPARLRSTR